MPTPLKAKAWHNDFARLGLIPRTAVIHTLKPLTPRTYLLRVEGVNVGFFEQQEQRRDRQFISLIDSILFISEHGEGSVQQALEFLTNSFLSKQIHLLLLTTYSMKAIYVCSDRENAKCEPYITFEKIRSELQASFEYKSIDDSSPIFGLGFGKKSFVLQLRTLGLPLDEQIIFNTESPDIANAECSSESDEWAFYQGLPREYDALRADNEQLKAKYQELWHKKELPKLFDERQKASYEHDKKELEECRNKLDKSLQDIRLLEGDCAHLQQRLETSKRQAELYKQMTDRRIADLESQLVQAQTANTPADSDMLQTIFDDNHEHHAPDLKHAINLWVDLYINGDIKDDSHSNKATFWIGKNTKYSENAKTSTDRIKEISSPSRYWSPHRKKESFE